MKKWFPGLEATQTIQLLLPQQFHVLGFATAFILSQVLNMPVPS